MPDILEQQLAKVVAEYETARVQSKHDDASDVLTNIQVRDLQTRCLAAIERIAGRRSVYFERATAVEKERTHAWDYLAAQIGIAKSLLSDLRDGYLRSLEELVHADVFSDFLEMADHLTKSGYKDAAAVIAGSTLEQHLRALCAKHCVAADTGGHPKKADAMNADLAKAGAYSKLDQKNVTAWLGLRNDAAHGNYGAYDGAQVAILVSSIREFLSRTPA
jgi:hypothetical protein